jgi:hypothetical protein
MIQKVLFTVVGRPHVDADRSVFGYKIPAYCGSAFGDNARKNTSKWMKDPDGLFYASIELFKGLG